MTGMQQGDALNGVSFQRRVWNWVIDCFGRDLANNRTERNRRFLEESVELAQSLGCDKATIHQIVEYVYARDPGIPEQEVGGVMVTFAALCEANNIEMAAAGRNELSRISSAEVMRKIRAKHSLKPEL